MGFEMPLILSAVPTVPCRVLQLCRPCSSLTSEAAGQDALYCTPVEGGEYGTRKVCSSQPLQEVKALLGFLGYTGSVDGRHNRYKITDMKSCSIQPWKSVFHTLTTHGHASKDPGELDFMGEIKRRAFGCEVCSEGLALLVKETTGVGEGGLF